MTKDKAIHLVFKMTLFASTHEDGQMVCISRFNNFYSVKAFPNKRLTVELQQSKLVKCLWNDQYHISPWSEKNLPSKNNVKYHIANEKSFKPALRSKEMIFIILTKPFWNQGKTILSIIYPGFKPKEPFSQLQIKKQYREGGFPRRNWERLLSWNPVCGLKCLSVNTYGWETCILASYQCSAWKQEAFCRVLSRDTHFLSSSLIVSGDTDKHFQATQ